jgi:hypothetical protein
MRDVTPEPFYIFPLRVGYLAAVSTLFIQLGAQRASLYVVPATALYCVTLWVADLLRGARASALRGHLLEGIAMAFIVAVIVSVVSAV